MLGDMRDAIYEQEYMFFYGPFVNRDMVLDSFWKALCLAYFSKCMDFFFLISKQRSSSPLFLQGEEGADHHYSSNM